MYREPAGDLSVGRTGDLSGDRTGDLSGDRTGNLTRGRTGEVTGDLSGDRSGDLTGDLTGNLTGNLTRDRSGDLNGDWTGDRAGDLSGDRSGDLTGNLTGDRTGEPVREPAGDRSGDLTGERSGDLSGDRTGDRIGDLTGKLEAYSRSDFYPFHMPGHKRNPDFMRLPEAAAIDITEIDGFDDLHQPEGILREAQERAAQIRGARRTWFLVNGSTCGILTAIAACTTPGGRILLARNAHRSVYHAVELRGLEPVYIYPDVHGPTGICEGIEARAVERLLDRYEGIEAVVITSPTYEGVISDIGGIARAVHAHGLPLIVDSAHGAHLGYHPGFAPSAVTQGADLVIESLHKTLPCLTQTALLHQCSTRTEGVRIQKYLSMYQTSSPSYVMLAAIDQCMELLGQRGPKLFTAYRDRLDRLRAALGKVCEAGSPEKAGFLREAKPSEEADPSMEAESSEKMEVLGGAEFPGEAKARKGCRQPCIRLLSGQELCQAAGSGYDDTKLIFYVQGISGGGPWLYDQLRERFHLQLEMASAEYALAMTTICDTQEGFERLLQAITRLNHELCDTGDIPENQPLPELLNGSLPEVPYMRSSAAAQLPVAYEAPWDAVGKISGTYLYIYPPGVPFLVPGERICVQVPELIRTYEAAGLRVRGLTAEGKLAVVDA